MTAAPPLPSDSPSDAPYDLAIIGGGVNGCGIARDAAGRGLRVLVCEQSDLAQATSSASTKLFHGGLRYLEYYEFRLVREALIERETLLRAMPHISWPLRFVLPHHSGLRPAWLLRLGLFIYDHLGGRKILPGTKTLDLTTHPTGAPLKGGFKKGFEYSDCWVEDSRLVVLNARDAARLGADVRPRTRVETAEATETANGGLWRLTLRNTRPKAGGAAATAATETAAAAENAHTAQDRETTAFARALINAGGPWVDDVIQGRARRNVPARIRLVRGSHIVTRKLYDHGRAYIFQQSDGRIIFAIPYETDYTLVGTTDVEHQGAPGDAVCTPEEQAYLLSAASEYFAQPLTDADVVWTYSGVRPLYDDGAKSATAATRDYVLELDDGAGAPMLNIFGGKITTYRRLAEAALAKVAPAFPAMGRPWTAGAPLPGGDFPVDQVDALADQLRTRFPFLTPPWALRLVRAYGTEAADVLADAETTADLGEDFGATLTAAEVNWLMDQEWAETAADVLWRRTKLGLRVDPAAAAQLDAYMRFRLNRRI